MKPRKNGVKIPRNFLEPFNKMQVFDNEKVKKLVQKYGLKEQYLKACQYIESGNYKLVDLKLRKPKSEGIYQFRISRKYRAMAFKDGGNLVVYKISDHQ